MGDLRREAEDVSVDRGPAARDHLAWLLETTNRMVRCQSVAMLLDLAYDAIRDGLGYDRIGLFLVDEERHTLAQRLGTDEHGRRFPATRSFRLDADTYHARLLADPCMQANGPGFLFLADATRELPPELRPHLDGRPRENVQVALRTAERVVGLIAVDNLTSGRPIRPADAVPLVAFANALATALENVSLLEQRARHIDALDADLHRRVDQLTWLQEVATAIAIPQDLDGVLDAIYASVREGLDYDRVGIFLIEPDAQGRPACWEVRGTDEQGRPALSINEPTHLDDPALATHSPDVHHLLQGHPFYYCPDRWAVTPAEYRYHLEGRMREQLVVALRHDEALFGFLSVDNLPSGRPISPTDAAPLVAFATPAALAISRARLWAAHEAQGRGLAQRVAELEWLREVGRAVNAARGFDEMLDVVYDGIREGLGYDRVGIILFDREQGSYQELRGTDAQGRKICPTDRTFTLAPDAAAWSDLAIMALLNGDDLYYTADVTAETPPELRHLLDGEPTHNLVVPLRTGEQTTGIISVDNLNSGRPISPDEAGPLLALANQVSTAIENARLHERERAERARLEVLLQSARALNSTLDRDQILRALAAQLVAALDASHVVFTIIDVANRTCKAIAHHTAPGHASLYAAEDCWEGLDEYPVLEPLLRTRVPYIGRLDDPRLDEVERRYLIEHQLQAEMLVPVVVRGEATSTLEVYWSRAVTIGAETVTLCTAIAEQAAVALENARLYADAATRAERDALTGLLNHRALLDGLDALLAGAKPCALLLLDVDNFKLFNDTYGHPVGDAVLTRVAATLREVCRDGDLAGRYGGDEFAVVLRAASVAEASAVQHRLAEAVRARPYVTPDGAIIPLSVSIGLACAPVDGQTRQALMAVADDTMYAAKRRARSAPAPNANGDMQTRRVATIRPRDAADLLGDSPFGVLEGLVNAVDAKDRYTREHSEDVTHLALLLAGALGLNDEERRVLAIAGPLHDVGKIAVPDRVLRKPGRLTEVERAIIKGHVTYGVAIIRGVLDDAAVVDAVAYHHERWDGRGYPHSLPGPETPLLGRIMQIADAVSAMLLDRPYRQGLPWPRVMAELRAGACTQFDPDLVEPFIAVVGATRIEAAS